MEAIKCEKLSFTYPKIECPALKDVSFSVEHGEFALLIGKSASGKSTLLRLLKKEIAPFGKVDGSIDINGTVGFVSQNVEENIVCDRVRSELSFGLTNLGVKPNEIKLLVAEVASYFNLADKLDNEVSSLSGGEKQMLNLASVMIMKPSILVLDEPTSQLDPISASRFIAMLKRLHFDFGTTIIMSEHNAEELFDYADSIMLLDKATLMMKGSQTETIDCLKTKLPEMLGTVPVQMRLFEDASTVMQCRQKLSGKALKPVLDENNKAEIAIKAKNICFAYEKGKDVLYNLSLNIEKGKINAIVGANGSGKTTLLKVLSGVKKHYRGKIKTNGKVAMLCQNPFDLFTFEKCENEVEFGQLTSFLEIDDIKEQHPYDISGGQAGRLALAKVLQTGADIILLDEPTKALDTALKIKLAKTFNGLCKQGKTIVIITHDIEFVGEYCDVASFLSAGTIVATANRQEFFSSFSFYTTTIARITNGISNNIVSLSDLERAGGLI